MLAQGQYSVCNKRRRSSRQTAGCPKKIIQYSERLGPVSAFKHNEKCLNERVIDSGKLTIEIGDLQGSFPRIAFLPFNQLTSFTDAEFMLLSLISLRLASLIKRIRGLNRQILISAFGGFLRSGSHAQRSAA